MRTSAEGCRALLSTAGRQLLPGHLHTTAGAVRWRSRGGIDMALEQAVVVAAHRRVRHGQAEPGDALVEIACDGLSYHVLLAEPDAVRLVDRLGGPAVDDWHHEAPVTTDPGPAAGAPYAPVDARGAVPPPTAPADVWASPGADAGWWSPPPPAPFGADPAAPAVVERLAGDALRWVPDSGWAAAGQPAGAGPQTLGGVLLGATGVPAAVLGLAVAAAVLRSRVAQLDGPAVLLLVVALVALVVGAYRFARALEAHLARRDAAAARSHPVLATLTADLRGRPLLLAVDPALTPAQPILVPLQTPLPAGVAALFLRSRALHLHCRGELEPGGTVVLSVSGPPTRHLQPAGPAWAPQPEELAGLLRGE